MGVQHNTYGKAQRAGGARRTNGADPCCFGMIRGARVQAAFDLSEGAPVVVRRDRDGWNTFATDCAETARIGCTSWVLSVVRTGRLVFGC